MIDIAGKLLIIAVLAMILVTGLTRGKFQFIVGGEIARRSRPMAFWALAGLFAALCAISILYLAGESGLSL